ncbi:MAG: S-layer homology domain-containing protein [Treponematales bacterium]
MALGACDPGSIIFGSSDPINLSSPQTAGAAGGGWTYEEDELGGVFVIHDQAAVTISGSTTSSRILVEADSATITLKNAGVILDADGACPIGLSDGSTLEIRLAGTSRLTAGIGAAAIHVPEGRALTISGADESGTLFARGGLNPSPWLRDTTTGAAGIGGGSNESAGIGGGIWGSGGNITISGGIVAAFGEDGSAGIGGGWGGEGGRIEIKGGEVEAVGGLFAAGIGGGPDSASGTITISGGTVAAAGTEGGAGVGSGPWGSIETITITSESGGSACGTGIPGFGPGRAVGPGCDAVSAGGSFIGPKGERDWPEGDTCEW